MAGTYDLFDSQQLTASSEYSSRNGEAIKFLQIHHATMTSLSGLIDLMQPGGRQVSANGALGNDGHLVEVVPATHRAFTSATGFDRQCITVETCNTTLSPTWGISDASRERLAQLAVAMYRLGLLGGLTRQFIIGHYEVPGTYATSCPGPDMRLDWIVARANEIYSGAATSTPVPRKDDEMLIFRAEAASTDGVIKNGFSYIFGANGALRPLSTLETGAYDFWDSGDRGDGRIPVRWVKWHGDDIRRVSLYAGVMEFTDAADGIPKLTGRIIYTDPKAPTFPRVSADVSQIVVPAPVLDYAAIAKAVNDDAAKRLAQ